MRCVNCSIDKKSPSSIFTTQPNISAFETANGQLAANKPQPPLANPVFIAYKTWNFNLYRSLLFFGHSVHMIMGDENERCLVVAVTVR